MDLLTKHNDADEWYPIHLPFDNHAMFVSLRIHTLFNTCVNPNRNPTPWTVRLSIWTLLMNLVLDSDIWIVRPVEDCIRYMRSVYVWYVRIYCLLTMDCLTLHKLSETIIFDIRSYKSTSSYFGYDGSQPLKSITTNVALKVPCCTKSLVFRNAILGISF